MFLETRFLFHKFYNNNFIFNSMKKGLVISIVVIATILVLGIFFINLNKNITLENKESNKIINQIILNTELEDISTGNMFKISDFEDKPVLLESFAVWCPTCTRQQQEIKKLHDEIGDDVISISLNTDPNEYASRILEHVERNGFDWYYAISPVDLTRLLIDEFGINIVNAPSAPVILICNNEARKLNSGLKSANELKKEVESCNG